MQKVLSVIVSFWVCLGAGSVEASTKRLTWAVFDIIPWSENNPDTKKRKDFAEAIERYWESFDTRLPRLSPSEQEWIEAEMGTKGERLNRALQSREYALWSLNRHTDLCLDTIRSVVSTFETEKSRQLEMFFWVRMINCYDGTDDLLVHLDRAKIPYNDKADLHVQTPISNTAQHIIVNKVAPMAMAETMGWTLEN